MKIRLIGSSDLVRCWANELERAYGVSGAEYPSRYSKGEIRVYFDLDDRQAAAIVGMGALQRDPPKPKKSNAQKRRRPEITADAEQGES